MLMWLYGKHGLAMGDNGDETANTCGVLVSELHIVIYKFIKSIFWFIYSYRLIIITITDNFWFIYS